MRFRSPASLSSSQQIYPVDLVTSVASFFLSRIDVLVDPELKKIGLETINTIRLETLDAFRDHGLPEKRLEDVLTD